MQMQLNLNMLGTRVAELWTRALPNEDSLGPGASWPYSVASEHLHMVFSVTADTGLRFPDAGTLQAWEDT